MLYGAPMEILCHDHLTLDDSPADVPAVTFSNGFSLCRDCAADRVRLEREISQDLERQHEERDRLIAQAMSTSPLPGWPLGS